MKMLATLAEMNLILRLTYFKNFFIASDAI